MLYNISVTIDNEKDFAEFCAKFASAGAIKNTLTAAVTEEPKASEKTAPKAPKAEKKAALAKDTEESKAEEEIATGDAAEVTYDDVKNIIMSVSRDKGRDAAVAVLAKFDLKKVTPDIPEDKWSDIVAEGKSVLAA